MSGRPRLLDLFCGAGGCSVGYDRAGFDVTGVDINPQPRYPYTFVQADAMTYPLDGFDVIHASPPCQAYSIAVHPDVQATMPDLLAPIRERLLASGKPWVIENVPGAPMRADYKLCGCMFALPNLQRERWFETSWYGFAMRSPCWHTDPVLSVTGNGTGQWGRNEWMAAYGRTPRLADARRSMGIEWMNRDELSQAIPPAYTEYIGAQLLEAMNVSSPG